MTVIIVTKKRNNGYLSTLWKYYNQTEVCIIKILKSETTHTLQIWCTAEERQQEDFMSRLQQLHQPHYRTAVFVSGTQDLVTATGDILRHNLG